eukprot:42334-Eustigmatos_ZCMA.PRE.1
MALPEPFASFESVTQPEPSSHDFHATCTSSMTLRNRGSTSVVDRSPKPTLSEVRCSTTWP